MLIVFCIFLSAINFYFLVKILSEKPYQKDIQDFQTQTERLMVEFNRITTRNIDLLDSRIEELNHKIRQSQKTEALLKELFEEAQKIEHLSSIIPNSRSTVSTNTVDDVLAQNDNTKNELPSVANINDIVDDIVEITENENQRSRNSSVRQLPDSQSTISTNTDNDISTQNQESSSIVDEYINDNLSLEELYSIKPSLDSQSSISKTSDDTSIEAEDRQLPVRRSSVSTNTDNTVDTIDNNSIKVKKDENQRSWADSLFEGVSVNKIKKHRKKIKNSQELLKKYIQENKTKEELLEMGYNINEINLVSLLEKNTK